MRGIDDDGKMAKALHGGNHAQIERVARVVGKRAHAALAENHLVVALGKDVLGSHQKLVERGGHAALQEDGFAAAPGSLEQREVLHVARADLNHVGVFFDEVERFVVDRFRDDPEAEPVADFRENLQPVLTEALKTVW